MIHLRNKLLLAFAFLTASFFLSISLGGEFFHQNVHHHQSKAAHDDCLLYQLLVQAFLSVVALGFGLPIIEFCRNVRINEVLVSRLQYLLPRLRAPPVSL